MNEEYYRFVSELNNDEIESLGNDYTSCWLFAYFIHNKYSLPIHNYECVYDISIHLSYFKIEKDGLYSCFICNDTEMHHFILMVNGNNLTLLSTYGGQEGIINKRYNKTTFNRRINTLSPEDYRDLFGITINIFDKVDLGTYEERIIHYTYKENN